LRAFIEEIGQELESIIGDGINETPAERDEDTLLAVAAA
jgi:hypothetical protein